MTMYKDKLILLICSLSDLSICESERTLLVYGLS